MQVSGTMYVAMIGTTQTPSRSCPYFFVFDSQHPIENAAYFYAGVRHHVCHYDRNDQDAKPKLPLFL
jgi:hypothetical protein